MTNFKTRDWLPQEPWQGPPLPEFLAIYWPWYKEAVAGAASIGIQVMDATKTSLVDPNALVAGTSYTATVTVTNKSTKLGVYVPAILTVHVLKRLAGAIIPGTTDLAWSATFPANTPSSSTSDFMVPVGSEGKTGYINVYIEDPASKVLRDVSLIIAVAAPEIVYAADVVVSV